MNLLESIEAELSKVLTQKLDLEDQIVALELAKEAVDKEFDRLNRAYKALTGQDAHSEALPQEPVQSALPVQAVPTSDQMPRPPAGPSCNGCGGEMFEGYRTLNNGRNVRLWICKDSGCNNETLA